MTVVNWSDVGEQIRQSTATILGDDWTAVQSQMGGAISDIVQASQIIEANRDRYPPGEYQAACDRHKLACDSLIKTSLGMSITAAEQVAAAAWQIISSALGVAIKAGI